MTGCLFIPERENLALLEERKAPPYLRHAGTGTPRCCLALSGGGFRAATFALGVMAGLDELGVMDQVDVISAVSGGSWAASWYYVQQYRAVTSRPDSVELPQIRKRMFDPNGEHLRYLEENSSFPPPRPNFIDDQVKITGLIQTRTGAWQGWIRQVYFHSPDADRKTVDKLDGTVGGGPSFARMATFIHQFQLPELVVGATWFPARTGSMWAWKDERPFWRRQVEMTPTWLGSDALGYEPWDVMDVDVGGILAKYKFVSLSAISSAAIAEPALFAGTITDQPLAALGLPVLPDLGWKVHWYRRTPQGIRYVTDVSFTDGGHSENLGVWPLLRRRCQRIIVVDSEHDETYAFPGYQILRKAALSELQSRLAVPAIDDGEWSIPDRRQPVVGGHAALPNGVEAKVVYVKLAMERPPSGYPDQVQEYAANHVRFPQEPTSDLRYERQQFRAYFALGRHRILEAAYLFRGDRSAAMISGGPRHSSVDRQ